MLLIILSWIYILTLAYIYGFVILKFIMGKDGSGTEGPRMKGPDSFLWCGVIFFTVYAQVFSLIHRVGAAANLVLIAGAVALAIYFRKQLYRRLREDMGHLGIARTVVLALCFVGMAYFTSRGYEHYDTLLYHAQAIHWIEDYGTVVGLGNAGFRFAYNSAAFPLTALFSFRYLAGQSLHTCAGLMALLLVITVVTGWKWEGRFRVSDCIRVMCLYYVTMILNQVVSPASDYFTMITVLYIVLQFVALLERKEKSPSAYGLLCVAGCFAVSLKVSAAPVILLTVIPAVMLIRARDGKTIGKFLGLGTLVVAPFLVRGVMISGYLVYPSTQPDIFPVDWKMNPQVAAADAHQISVWGKGIENEPDSDMPVTEWFPIWLSRQKTSTEKLLVAADIPMIVLLVAMMLYDIKRRKRSWEWQAVELTVIISWLFWFFSAPLTRYGWCYILLLPAFVGGRILESIPWKQFHRICLVLLVLVGCYKCFRVGQLMWDSRLMPYYVRQQDYSAVEVEETVKDGQVFYESVTGLLGYEPFPTVDNSDDFKLRGDSIEDGFIPFTQ